MNFFLLSLNHLCLFILNNKKLLPWVLIKCLMHNSLLILIIVIQKIPVGNKYIIQNHIMDLKAFYIQDHQTAAVSVSSL